MVKSNIRHIIIALAIGLIGFSIWQFNHIIWHMLIALVLSLIGNPVVKILSKLNYKGIKMPRSLSATLSLLIIWFTIIGLISLIVPIIVKEAKLISNIDINNLTEYFSDEFDQIKEQVNIIKKHSDPDFSFDEYIKSKLKTFLDITYLTNLVNSLTVALGDIFVAFFSISFMTFFFMKDDKLWTNMILALTPDQHIDKIRNILTSIKNLLVRYFIGLILEVFIVMALNTLWLKIIGLEFGQAMVLGFITGMLNIVPYIGPLIGTILGTALGTALTVEAGAYNLILPRMLYFAIAFVGTQVIDNLLLQPIIYSNSVKAHPLEIFIVIMIAGSLAGITGMILAIPTYTLVRVIAREFLSQFKAIRELTKNMQ